MSRAIAACIALVLGWPGAASAQVLIGQTVDAGDERPIPGVDLRLLDAAGDTVVTWVSDADGRFLLRAPLPGRYVLVGSRLGYEAVRIPDVDLRQGEELVVRVRLGARPVELEPLEVVQRRGQGLFTDYYFRLDRHRKTGWGTVLDRAALEELTGTSALEAIRRQPWIYQHGHGARTTLYIRHHGRYCVPRVFFNGLRVGGDVLVMPVSSLEGIEIYRGNEVPAEAGGGGCGVIYVWTRRDWVTPEAEAQPRAGRRHTAWLTYGGLAAFVALALITVR